MGFELDSYEVDKTFEVTQIDCGRDILPIDTEISCRFQNNGDHVFESVGLTPRIENIPDTIDISFEQFKTTVSTDKVWECKKWSSKDESGIYCDVK